MSDGVNFGVRLVVAYGAPAMLCCLVLNHALPLYVVACHVALGAGVGVWRYRRRWPGDPGKRDGKGRRGTPAFAPERPLGLCPAGGC